MTATVAADTLRLAVERQKAGDLGGAEALCRQVLATRPGDAITLHRLGNILHRAGRAGEAIDCFQQALILRPDDVATMVDLAHVLTDSERFDEALEWHRRVVFIAPEVAQVHFNLACALHQSDRLAAAEEAYRMALDLEPAFADAHLNLGIVLREVARGDEALAQFEHVLKLRPDDPQAHLQRSLTWLQAGNFSQGWNEYEWRWRAEIKPRPFTRPCWDGSPLEKRSLLIHSEQGVGDEIQFASCIPEIARQASHCTVECDPRLVPLFARSFPLCEVVPRMSADVPSPYEAVCDLQIPIASLPRFVRRNAESFPRMRRYLKPNPRLVSKWQARYAELGRGLKVGITWLGGNRPDFRRRRSTSLESWQPVLRVPGVCFANLQYGDKALELAALQEQCGVTIHDWPHEALQQDVDDAAARVAALDLVITVDNSTAHLAGALGVPVWTLLPAAPDFRWMLDCSDSLWYAGMILFRQQNLGNWSDVFSTVAARLHTVVTKSIDAESSR